MDAFWLLLLGAGVGVLAGLLGVGGGIVMVPALLFLPPFWGAKAFDIVQATAISSLQCLASGLMAIVAHARRGAMSWLVLWPLALGTLLGSALGGLWSAWIPQVWLYALFCLILILTLSKKSLPPDAEGSDRSFQPTRGLAEQFLVSGGIGFLSANTGVGGAILLLPYLVYRLGVPVRLAIGCGAGYVVFTALGSVAGKWAADVVPWEPTLWIAFGAMVGAALGARLSHQVPVVWLMRGLKILVLVSLVKMVSQLVGLLL